MENNYLDKFEILPTAERQTDSSRTSLSSIFTVSHPSTALTGLTSDFCTAYEVKGSISYIILKKITGTSYKSLLFFIHSRRTRQNSSMKKVEKT